MAARSSSSVTMSRTRCAACPSGTNSCTEGGSSHASFTRHGRKLFVMPPSESPPTAEVEPLWPYRDTLLGPPKQWCLRQGAPEYPILGDAAAADPFAGRALGGHQAQVAHEPARALE